MTTTHAPECWVRLDGEEQDGTIEAFELISARRALKLLKQSLGRVRLLDLLHDEIAAGNAFLRAQTQRSAGQETTGTTTLRAQGITVAQFTRWLSRAFGREDVLLAGHPEHYSIHSEAGGHVNIVETLGEHVCSFFMREWDDSEVTRPGPPSPAGGAANARRSRLVLEDGTVVGSISTSFEGGAEGFTARLSVTLPATCGPQVEQHLEHFAVEFRNWILLAAAEQTASAQGSSAAVGHAQDVETSR